MGKDDKPCRTMVFLLARPVPRYEDVLELLPFFSCPLSFFKKIIHLESLSTVDFGSFARDILDTNIDSSLSQTLFNSIEQYYSQQLDGIITY